ncbi:MAG: hypothetical protein LBV13_00800, partial [Methanomassiliicoccaceae archaeon]|nr:hypothetical protein [Methanomassiliicoccaceae archaeon]
MLDLRLYGYTGATDIDGALIPARVTAVYRERYEIVCERGFTRAKLKSGAYMTGQPEMLYPTVGDFVH